MALSKITFENKTALDSSPAVSEINKISDSNINEIKMVVNNGLSQVDINTVNIETLTNTLNTFMSEIYKEVYPIGAHYITSSTENPNVLFPGTTWIQITDTYIVAAGSTYKVGTTYGASSHTHTSAAHTHTIAGHTHTSAAHTHTVNGHTHTTSNHTLTVSEMPSHTHAQNSHYHAGLSYGSPDGGGNTCVVSTTYDSTGCIELGWSRSSTGVPYDNVYTKYATATNKDTGGGQGHNHGNTGSTSLTTNSTTPGSTGSTSLTTNSTTPGNTGSASNLPPSIARYVWERTA